MAGETNGRRGSRAEESPARWSSSFKDQLYRRASMFVIVVHTMVIPVSMLLFSFVCIMPLFWPLLILYGFVIFFDTRSEKGVPLNWIQKKCRSCIWWKVFAYYFPITVHKTVDLEPSDPPLRGTSMMGTVSPWSWPDLPLLICFWPFIIVAKLVWKVIRRPLRGSRLINTEKSALHLQESSESPSKPSKKYIFGISPHGIVSMGVFAGMGTEGANWSQLFPGVTVRLLTLATNFYLPFYRQYLLATGVASVSKQSCINLLNNNQNIGIVLGGARESLLAEPGEFNLILNKRKGFVKVALETGASLVPVLSFGENDIYNQVQFPEDSWGHRIHLWMTQYLGFTVPLFYARGIWSYNDGFIAYRLPINIVVGRPIDVPLTPNATDEQVDYYHGLYIAQVKELFDENVEKYSPGVELRIVD